MLAHIMPISCAAECGVYIQWGYKIIYKIHPAISLSDWSLFDCHKYIVDFETCVTKAVAALEVAGLDQLRKNQEETIQKVESQVTLERESALELIRKHMERQPRPTATATPVSQSEPARQD